MANINEVMKKSIEMNSQISSLLKFSTFEEYGDLSDLHYDRADSEQIFIAEELRLVMEKLMEVHDRISNLSLPIKEVSELHKNSAGRYETEKGHCYTSGCQIEALINDDRHEFPYWIRTRVEHDGTDYYLVARRNIKLNGLKVRVR